MKRNGPNEYAEEFVREILEGAVSEVEDSEAEKPEPSPDNLLDYGRRRHFALGLMIVALFVLLLAFVLPEEEVFLWIGYSVLLILVGAWQWDRAKRELFVQTEDTPVASEGAPKLTVHSVDGDAR